SEIPMCNAFGRHRIDEALSVNIFSTQSGFPDMSKGEKSEDECVRLSCTSIFAGDLKRVINFPGIFLSVSEGFSIMLHENTAMTSAMGKAAPAFSIGERYGK